MMNAPGAVTIKQLRELHLKVNLPHAHVAPPSEAQAPAAS
jgi:hypothetical protein